MTSARRERPQHGAPAAPQAAREAPHSLVARVLELQRSAGNAAVARMLARRRLQRQGWPEAHKGGWNEQAREVAGTVRVEITGLKTGGTKAADVGKKTPTKERAGDASGGRAVVVVPDGTDFSHGKLEVLLLFHGLGESAGIGYRERTDDDDMGAKGTVHDVEADVIPQQLASSGRNMIAILAQGLALPPSKDERERFFIPDAGRYVAEVLSKLEAQLKPLRPDVSIPANVKPYRIVLAGHSGGGPPAVAAADALQGSDWAKSSPLLLFDGINGPGELKTVRETLRRWLTEDLEHLQGAKDPLGELKRRGLKFRSTYSNSWEGYKIHHEGGRYETKWGVVVITPGKDKTNKKDPEQFESLNGWLDDWFEENAEGNVSADVLTEWKKQYVTHEEAGGHHHHQIGTGVPATGKDRDPAPAGLEGAAKKAGVPKYEKGTGHLEQGLGGLPADAPRPKPAPITQPAPPPPPPPPPPAPSHSLLEEDAEETRRRVFA